MIAIAKAAAMEETGTGRRACTQATAGVGRPRGEIDARNAKGGATPSMMTIEVFDCEFYFLCTGFSCVRTRQLLRRR